MTKKQIEELKKARELEFSDPEKEDAKRKEEDFRTAARELSRHLDMMVEEGWNRYEALIFLSNAARPSN